MATYPYIELITSDTTTVNKKFRVLVEGYLPTYTKTGIIDDTLGGGVDITQGNIRHTYEMILRVRETEPVSGYGDLQDLVTLFLLDDPTATPTDVITFIDHYSSEMDVYMVGTFMQSLMGCMIEGTEAWFLVRLTLLEKT